MDGSINCSSYSNVPNDAIEAANPGYELFASSIPKIFFQQLRFRNWVKPLGSYSQPSSRPKPMTGSVEVGETVFTGVVE